ncbi:hypothetical protein CHUAL_011844 [Chamberlinius hualienensis]
MSTMNFQRTFTPRPPEKGSFPLDHDGECKVNMLKYMICLRNNDNINTNCRHLAKDYLECRMNRNLMRKEEWSKLGLEDLAKNNEPCNCKLD